MDPEGFSAASLFRWDAARALAAPPPPPAPQAPPLAPAYGTRLGGLEELLAAYGIRYFTAAKIAELGFTASTLVDMKEEELDDMMNSLSHIFRWDLLVGERYGVKAAVRAERRRIQEEEECLRRRQMLVSDPHHHHHHQYHALDALSQEGLSEEPVQQDQREAAGSGGGATWDAATGGKKLNRNEPRRRRKEKVNGGAEMDEHDVDEELDNGGEGAGSDQSRQREHPFIVTEPGEVARGKKNGLDYLFHLYEQCREFLLQVQAIAKERGDKCPTKVTNQVFRFAKKAGATYINKPKMRHYVHCYALHCLDEKASDSLRRAFKARGENVGAWRQACYKPLVAITSRHGWDIDALFNSHPRLSIWYVPTKLRQLCHAQRHAAAASGASIEATVEQPHHPGF